MLPHVAGRRVQVGFEHTLQPVLVQLGIASGAWERGPHPACCSVQGFVDKHHFGGALGTSKHFAPDRVIDPPLGLAVGVQGLVHPADFRLDLVEQRAAGIGEPVEIERQAVVGGDEAGERREIVLDGSPKAPTRLGEALLGPRRFEFLPVGLGRRPAPLRRHAGHARAGETVQHQIAGLGVVEDRGYDRQVWHLRVVSVRPVHGVGLAFADIDGKRLAAVRLVRVVGVAVCVHERAQERVRTGRMPGRVREGENVLDLAVGEADFVLPALEQVL